MSETQRLKDKIEELEQEVQSKNLELMRYRAELSKANDALERMISQVTQELAFAQTLQKLLSPTEFPNIHGFDFSTKFVPGSRFGGDYFDIFEHEDKLKFGILISSASGYGLSSVLLAVIIKLSSQIEARRGLPPHQVVAQLAKEVVPQIKNQDQAALFYGVIDRRNFELEYSSVGGITGLVQVHGQDRLTELKACSGPLGVGFDVVPTSSRVQLNPKDRFILATEGVTKSQSPDGKIWGEDGLITAIRQAPRSGVHELRNEILFGNEKFTGRKDPLRDQTVLVAEVKDRVIKLARGGSPS